MNILKKLALGVAMIGMIFTTACSGSETASSGNDGEASKEVPTINISWGKELHTGIMEIPGERVEEFKAQGVYFNPISETQFELIKGDEKLALINFIPTKGGSEVATLMSQGHLDAAFTSNTAILSAVDQGTPAKILAPIQSDGVGVVFPVDKDFKNWEDVKNYIQASEMPVKIGYHSPVSGPRIVIESVLKQEGLKVTEDPGETNADVLLVDLKGITNLLPSLSSGQVDAWIGPSHHPEAAEVEGLGKVVLNLEDLPPNGQWEGFPCCVFAATEKILSENPDVFEALGELVTNNAEYCTEHKEEVAQVMSEVIGVKKEAIMMSKIKYSTEPSDKWINGIGVYVKALTDMDKLTGTLKEKTYEDIQKEVFDFQYVEKFHEK